MSGTRGGLVVRGQLSDPHDKPVGKLQVVAGRVELIRGGLAWSGAAGSFVCEGDIIKTAEDGSTTILFVDGTTFRLGSKSCITIDAFDPAETAPGRSCVRVIRGEVGFLPGRKVREGQLEVETPSAAIRGTGVAALAGSLAALFVLCLVEEANAASEEIVIFDFDDVTVKDLQHGTFEVVTKGQNPQVFIVDDPGHTLVLHPRGSGFSIEVVANTRAQMLDFQSAYKSAFDIYSRGSQDPFFQLFQRTAGGLGSGGSFDLNQLPKFVPLLNIGTQPSVTPPPFIFHADAKTAGAGSPPLPITGLPTVIVLPISRFQIGEVPFSPNLKPHVANSTYETIVSVTISNIPAGYSFRVGTETTLRTGTTLTFTAADLAAGINLITPASGVTETHLDVFVTALGLGGLRNSDVVALPLTLDQDPTGKVEWHGGTGNWDDPSKWSTSFIPLPTEDAVIPVSSTPGETVYVTSSTPVSLNSLRLDSGVTLEVAASSFGINAADANPLSNNGGTIKVDSGASFSVGNNAHPGQLVVNAGTIEAAGGSITFISANVSNTGTMEVIDGSITLMSTTVTNPGLIRIDAPTLPMSSVLELQNSTIDSGNLINHSLIKVTSGTSNSIHDVVSFSNDGTLQVTGNGTVLLLSNETLNNAGGHIQVDSNATLNLTTVTIAGGELTGSGQINVTGNGTTTTLDGNTDAVTIDTGTAVTLQTGTTLKLDGTIQGGGEISIAGASAIVADGTVGVPIDAALLGDNLLLTLSGTANLTVTQLQGDLTATSLSGTLTVTTADNTADNTISITTGSGAATITGTAAGTVDTVTINAAAMGAAKTLTLHGDDDFIVTGLVGDLIDDGAGTLNVTTVDNTADNTISITTGSGAATITGTAAGTVDTVTVNAASMGAAKTLTLHGDDNFVVTGLVGDLTDDGAGTLNVTTADNTADNTISITTGSGAATITGTAAGTVDTVTVNATSMGAAKMLTLHGDDNFIVTGLVGDLTDDGAGMLTVTTADNTADNTIAITTGSGATTITGTAAGTVDTVTVNAATMGAAKTLTLHGDDNFIVTGLVGDLTDDGAGTLNVTTADNTADNTISITTGSGAATITGTAAATIDTVTINAVALLATNSLALHGDDNFIVTGLVGDLTDDGASTLNVTTADNTADNTISITTGSGAATITGTAAGTVDTVTVNAAAVLAANSLNLHGDDNFVVTGLVGDLTDDGAGTLTVTTADNTADNTISITTGSGAATITGAAAGTVDTVTVNAAAMGAAKTLTLHGDDNFIVTGLVGDLTDDGAGTLNVTTADNTADNTISITTGSGAATITGTAAGTVDTVTINAAAVLAANSLTLHGDDNFIVTGLVGDLTDDGAGTLNVTTADNTADNTISITTGSGAATITGTAAGTVDTVTINATAVLAANSLTLHGDDNFIVTGLVGDLTDDGAGTLTVTTADNTADNTISITTGSGATTITGTAAATIDTVTINAAALLATNSLALHGGDNFVVTGLVGDLTDDGAGTLAVTTADNTADNTISITTGSGAATITGTAAATIDTVTINAAALLATNSLALHGGDNFVVTGLVGDLTDDGAGTLTVTTADNTADNTISITTGSGATTITGTAGVTKDTVSVDATSLLTTNSLTLHGGDNFTVTHLTANLTDDGTGDLNVTTDDVASLTITTGSGANTINAQALTSGHTLTLQGSAAASITLAGGNLTASADTGNLTVTATSGTSTIITGSGADIITGGAGADMLTGGGGADTFIFKTLADSLASAFDTITDFTSGTDLFGVTQLPTSLNIASTTGTGDLAQDLTNILNSATLLANGAAEVTISGGADAGTYLVINAGTAGYHSGSDAVIKLQNGATVHTGDFVVA